MPRPKIKASNIILAVGVSLVILSVAILVFSSLSAGNNAKNARSAAESLKELMPNIENTVPDDRINITMPASELSGESFCGIIEIPSFGTLLPISEAWSRTGVNKYPCKFTGSIYDGSLIVGGSEAKGQFDFSEKIGNGAPVFITDMTGGRYSYEVTNIRKSNDVSYEYLSSLDADLILFARNTYSFDYTVISCTFSFKLK